MEKRFVDTVIFDFDGVVADTVQDITTAANLTLAHYGMQPLSVDEVRGLIGGGAEPLVRKMLQDRVDELYDDAIVFFKKRYGECYNVLTDLYPGVRSVLTHYRVRGKKLAIATNKVERLAKGLLDKLHIQYYFDVVIGPESITHRKPHPEAVTKILEKLGTRPENAVMIGDVAADILSGKAAGTATCGVLYGYGSQAEVEGSEPDYIVRSYLTELLDYID
jgi:2-phosphoglycolate phosphatase